MEALLNKHVSNKHSGGTKFFDDLDLPVAVQEVFIEYKCGNVQNIYEEQWEIWLCLIGWLYNENLDDSNV